MKRLLSLAVAATAIAAASSARANMLVNGGLESARPPKQPDNLLYVTPNTTSNPLTGWTVEAGMIDLVPTSYWASSQGNWSVDMVGSPGLGRISQDVTTVAATTYTLLFDLAFNFQAGPLREKNDVKLLRVEAIGADGITVLESQLYSGLAALRTRTSMLFDTKVFTFTADGTVSTIRFSAVAPLLRDPAAKLYTGPVIDNLVLEASGNPIPEPASLALLGTGAIALLTRRTRRR